MDNINHLMDLANAVIPRPATYSPPIEVLPVIRVLRDEKRLAWDEIRDWMEENAGLKRSRFYWASFYDSNVQSRAAST